MCGDNGRKENNMPTVRCFELAAHWGCCSLLQPCLLIKTVLELRAFWASVTAERQRLAMPSVTLDRNLRLHGAARHCCVNTSDWGASMMSGQQWAPSLKSREGGIPQIKPLIQYMWKSTNIVHFHSSQFDFSHLWGSFGNDKNKNYLAFTLI